MLILIFNILLDQNLLQPPAYSQSHLIEPFHKLSFRKS